MIRERPWRYVFALAALWTLPACDDAVVKSAAPAPGAQAGNPAAKPVDAAAAKPAVAELTYSPIGKRDPFRSYLADLKANETQEHRPLLPTEKYELDQYRLTGLITGTSQPKALVEDPEGVGHTMSIGERIGKNGGKITRISANGIMIVEEYVNPLGKPERVSITLKLPEEKNALVP